MRITRRQVLAAMACATAAGGLGAGGVALRWWDRAPAAPLRVMSLDEYEFAQALSEAWFPAGGVPALSGADADLGGFLDEVLTTTEPTNRKLLKLLMQALDDRPVLIWGAPYRRLPLESRQAILRGWSAGNPLIRNGVTGLMALLVMGWTTHPDVAVVLQPSFGCGYGR